MEDEVLTGNHPINPRDLQTSEDAFEQTISVMEIQIIKSVLFHPLNYAKKLIQIGYEPLPPTQTRLYFIGPSAMILPNMFSYVKHIYDVDGFTGCFRGLTAFIWLNFSLVMCYHTVILKNLESVQEALNENNYLALMKWDVAASAAAIFISHPFYVIANRQMASFVGHEIKYNGLFKVLYEIGLDEGMTAWFSGFMPRLIGDITEILIFYSLFYVVHRYITKDKAFRPFITFGCTYFATLFSYPFHVVGACMSVNGAQLKAGLPPFIPYFEQNWFKCYDYLSTNQQLYRGRNIFWRRYNPINHFKI